MRYPRPDENRVTVETYLEMGRRPHGFYGTYDMVSSVPTTERCPEYMNHVYIVC